jgi:hypothetical protein
LPDLRFVKFQAKTVLIELKGYCINQSTKLQVSFCKHFFACFSYPVLWKEGNSFLILKYGKGFKLKVIALNLEALMKRA